MKLSPAERETIILFSDADDTASVYTYDRRLIKKLDVLCRKCPEEVYEEKKRSSAGAKSYIVPKSCVSVREPFSRARREAASRRAKEAGTVPPDRSKSSNSEEEYREMGAGLRLCALFPGKDGIWQKNRAAGTG